MEGPGPRPRRSLYAPSVMPHPVIVPNKFDAGRLLQKRSGKSYLRALPSWEYNKPYTCPRCHRSLETFEHAILSCPGREPPSNRPLHAVSDVGPDAPVWPSATLLGALSRFIRATRTAFPPGMFSRPTSSTSSASSQSSHIVSFGCFMSSQES